MAAEAPLQWAVLLRSPDKGAPWAGVSADRSTVLVTDSAGGIEFNISPEGVVAQVVDATGAKTGDPMPLADLISLFGVIPAHEDDL